MDRTKFLFLWIVLTIATLPVPAWSYIGPGAGIGAILFVVVLVLGALLVLFGLLWFPIKRMLKSKKASPKPDADQPPQ